ncbi:hypothetical protein L3N51_01874 [Metallosphaera sp. J1]|nr:hypothetical protein [Metallosphaera javensis (ex Hofmann et al. 2022)]
MISSVQVYVIFIYASNVYKIVSDVISVRVKRQLKEKAEELGIDIRQVVEKALGEEIKKREEEEIRKSAEIIVENMKEVKIQEWIKLVRETRDER